MDFKTCHAFFSEIQTKLVEKARTLKNVLDNISSNVDIVFRFVLNYKIQNQMMRRYIAKVQNYEYQYENPSIKTIQFIIFLKKRRLFEKQDSPYLPQNIVFTIADSVNKGDFTVVLSDIQIKSKGKRFAGNDCLLQLMPSPIQIGNIKVTGVNGCSHICNISSELVWVSDKNNLVLANTKGETLHHLNDLYYLQHTSKLSSSRTGLHTVNGIGELFYINTDFVITKLSSDLKTTSTFITRTDFEWTPVCIHCSMITGDLLVGIVGTAPGKISKPIAKINRYNTNGELTQAIQFDKSKNGIHDNLSFIAENNNGDVVVSDIFRVVVTNKEGHYRFSYIGRSKTLQIPEQLCTDALSNILVCYKLKNCVELINRDGQFICTLLGAYNMFTSWSLSYDVSTHAIWVGSSDTNMLSIWRYIARKNSPLNGDHN